MVTSLLLVPATCTLALASPAVAGIREDVRDVYGTRVDPMDYRDLNCDGSIGVSDWAIANQLVRIHSAPDFNPFKAVDDNFGATVEEMGHDFPFEADLNGDCVVDDTDVPAPVKSASAVGGTGTGDFLQVLSEDWGTEGDSPADLNCDGAVGVPDFLYVGQVINAQYATYFDQWTAARAGYGSQVGDENYHPAVDNGDCVIGMADLYQAILNAAEEQ
jgi:hypothetical protein